MRWWRALICTLAFLVLPNITWAQDRFALLIGNGDYSPKIGKLTNPLTDVGIVKAALLGVGFDPKNVEVIANANLGAINKARREFQQRLRAAGPDALGFFYYTGHGAASRLDDKHDASNFLIPIDVDDTKGPLEMFESSLPLSEVVHDLRFAAPFADLIIVFDACRNELKIVAGDIDFKTFVAEPLPQNGNTLLGFSTKPSLVAKDGGVGGGPFAKSLAQELVKKGQHEEEVFFNVRLAVLAATAQKQEPSYNDGFKKRLYFVEAPPSVSDEEAAAWNAALSSNSVDGYRDFIQHFPASSQGREATRRLQEREEEITWNLALSGGQREHFESFLARYPTGRFAARARDQLAAIASAEEDRDWRSAKKDGSETSILEFLAKYPNTQRYAEAREAISKIRTASAEIKAPGQDEASAWTATQQLDSIPGYNKFLLEHGNSANAANAKGRLAALLEQQEWNNVRVTKSAAGLRKFATKYPGGPHVTDANELASSLEASPVSQPSIQVAIASKDNTLDQQKRLERQNLFFPRGAFSSFTGGRISERLDFRKAQPIRRLLLTNSLTTLYSGGDDGTVRTWDLNGLQKSQSLSPAHSKRIYALARSDTTRYLATGAWDRQVFLWDSNTNALAAKIAVRPEIYSMAFSPTGRWIAAGGTNGQVDFIATKDQRVVNRRETTPARTIFALAYLPNKSEDLILGDASGALRRWSVIKNQQIYLPSAHREKILTLTVSPDGALVASAGTDRSVKIWTNKLTPVLEIPQAHRHYVTSLRFSPDGRYLASGGADALIRIWNVSSGKLIRDPLIGHTGDVEDIEFSPDGRYMFSSSEDKTVRIWDVNASRLLYTMVAFPSGNYVIFDPEQRYLASDEIGALLSRDRTN
jgi:WD40 repeat protein/uncharacterized caspase-like protein